MMTRVRKQAIVDQTGCVACGSCIKICPKGAISVWKGCFVRVSEERCVGCGLCAKTCPAGCISVKERGTAE